MPAVSGTKLSGRDTNALARELALALGVEERPVTRGSRHELLFLSDVHEALAGTRPDSSDAYALVASVMEAAGITYDPFNDTDEATADGARKQVHARAYSRLLAAISSTPRCFILNVTDSERGAAWETDNETTYRFDDRVSGRKPLLVAGQGSRVVYYSTSRSTEYQMQFIAAARVGYVAGGALGPWEASLSNYARFPDPVPRRDVDLPGWNHQHAITEISHETWAALLRAGGLDTGHVAAVASDPESPVDDGAGEVSVRRLDEAFPAASAAPRVDVPNILPQGLLSGPAPRTPEYASAGDALEPVDRKLAPSRSANPKRDRLAELRAVELATVALSADGWTLVRDRQRDGVGYDLEFQNGDRRLNLEVKGIQGIELVFNLTPKELWRAQSDSDWALVAVTSVLSTRNARVHFVTRDRIVGAQKNILGFRVRV